MRFRTNPVHQFVAPRAWARVLAKFCQILSAGFLVWAHFRACVGLFGPLYVTSTDLDIGAQTNELARNIGKIAGFKMERASAARRLFQVGFAKVAGEHRTHIARNRVGSGRRSLNRLVAEIAAIRSSPIPPSKRSNMAQELRSQIGAKRLVCSECRSRDGDMVVTGTKQRTDR
jgi:hypothetical protein